MRIIHISSECSPFAKVGGLGDVTSGLSRELSRQGESVEIILPKYDTIDEKELKNLTIEIESLPVKEGKKIITTSIWSACYDGIKLFLVDPKHKKKYFHRGDIYCQKDDINRFTFFSKAALEFLLMRNENIDIVHLHDWPTATIASLYNLDYQKKGLHIGGILLTIHNIKHQGICSKKVLTELGIKETAVFQNPSCFKNYNLLKSGIDYADALNAVSPTYAREILSKDKGYGLDKTLHQCQDKLYGILNGIDLIYWNPQTDPYLKTCYPVAPNEIEGIKAAKLQNRNELFRKLQLPKASGPTVCCITRLVAQKGPELIYHAIIQTLQNGGTFILLGSRPPKKLKKAFEKLKHPNLYTFFGFDEALAHLTYAASDLIVIPSLFEPCGLTQMIAMRYGTVPFVHKTGGLADTVFDIDTSIEPMEERCGFTFDKPTFEDLSCALDRAFETFRNHTHKWDELLKNGLQKDFSWHRSATEYKNLYQKIIHQFAT